MIDDKKMTEAAIKYSKELDKNQTLSFAYRDFKAGAHWALNELLKDLWHDASEKPILREGSLSLVEIYDGRIALWKTCQVYESICNRKGFVVRWTCIDGLLSKEGGEQ